MTRPERGQQCPRRVPARLYLAGDCAERAEVEKMKWWAVQGLNL